MRFVLGVVVGLVVAAVLAGAALVLRDSAQANPDVYGDGKEFGRYLVSGMRTPQRDELRSSGDAGIRGFCVFIRDEATADENDEIEHADLVHEGARWLRGCEVGVSGALGEDD
ncbi:hypothetical protein [Mumia zhuanghuii]|uniref:Uncharacterized protein n=1 Tax=Mumia zhuanghuii TaxID=2585211 RepID=A0A5C4MHH5_9ACTN|nr:hypothetical protein [Mumia zhuanghuii]TNC42304.1 hypothetical protein FHE65_21405 [Mumia zhuanghuii]TNC42535.1 hypothetical protein FHE65_20560 [Mumia zhuanghuii]